MIITGSSFKDISGRKNLMQNTIMSITNFAAQFTRKEDYCRNMFETPCLIVRLLQV